jgi:hypothetical protein
MRPLAQEDADNLRRLALGEDMVLYVPQLTTWLLEVAAGVEQAAKRVTPDDAMPRSGRSPCES